MALEFKMAPGTSAAESEFQCGIEEGKGKDGGGTHFSWVSRLYEGVYEGARK